MIDQDLIVRSITEAAAEVFSTMLGMEVRFVGPAASTRAPELGIISLIGITGDWGGSGVFCCSPALAAILCARMLGVDYDPSVCSVDDDVMDVVAEITNMMIGNVKNGLEPITGPLAISVPTVIHGRNFDFRNVSGLRCAALSFVAEGKTFEVRVSLAPAAEHPATLSRIPVLGLAHI